MKKKLPIYVFLMLILALFFCVACNRDGNNDDNPSSEQSFFETVQMANSKEFAFTNDICGWKTGSATELDSAKWVVSPKTGCGAVKLSGKDASDSDVVPNASICNKFALSSNDRTLVIDANIIGDSATALRAKVILSDDSSVNLVSNNTFNRVDANGYYTLDGNSQTVFSFDLSSHCQKTVILMIECDSLSKESSTGVYINGIKITKDYNPLSARDSWNAQQIAQDYQLRGNVSYSEQGIVFSNNGNGSSIANTIRISDEKPYLKISVEQIGNTAPQVCLWCDGELVKAENGDGNYVSGKVGEVTEYVYDLLDYVDIITSIQISNENGGVCRLSKIEFISSKQGYSNATSWSAEELYKSWTREGCVTKHTEGVCLEKSSKNASITNVIKIDEQHCYLNISFRKFVRPSGQAQDENPQVVVYVDDRLVRSVDNVNDSVTVDCDDYVTFCYDLTAYVGTSVTVKISNTAGPHACFDTVYLDATKEIEPILYNSEQYTVGYLQALATVSGKSFVFDTDSKGWTLGSQGKEYDKSQWIEQGRTGEPCIRLEGSDFGDNRNFVPNAWMVGKFTLTSADKYLFVKITSPSDADTSLRVRAIIIENGQIVSENLVSTTYEKQIDEYGYYLVNSNSPSKFNFDVSKYVGKTIYISIEQDDNREGSGEILEVYNAKFTTVDTVLSQYTEWNSSLIAEDWEMHGNVEVHSEGLCIECYEDSSYITNFASVLNGKPYFKLSFRKFVRDGEQDADPQIKLYVNNTLLRATGSAQDYVTVSGEEFVTFYYDLSTFEGTNVTLKIENVLGEHACFNYVGFAVTME